MLIFKMHMTLDSFVAEDGEAVDTQAKCLGSTTLNDPRWADTTVLSNEVAAAVGELKAKPGRELQAHGSGALIRWLFDNDLVDEIDWSTSPGVVGDATRLFPYAGSRRLSWRSTVHSLCTSNGVDASVLAS